MRHLLILLIFFGLSTSTKASNHNQCPEFEVVNAFEPLNPKRPLVSEADKNIFKTSEFNAVNGKITDWINIYKNSFFQKVALPDANKTLNFMLTKLNLAKDKLVQPHRQRCQELIERIIIMRSQPELSHKVSDMLEVAILASEFFTRASSTPSAKLEKSIKAFYNNKMFYKSVLANSNQAMPFVTTEPLSIRELNDLTPYPIYPNELKITSGLADQQDMNPLQFLDHDFGHNAVKAASGYTDFELLQNLREGKLLSAMEMIKQREKLYVLFRQKVALTKSAKKKELLELVWFDYFHENNGLFDMQALQRPPSEFKNNYEWCEKIKKRIHLPYDYRLNLKTKVDDISFQDVLDAIQDIQGLYKKP